jgi:hypothetical protein
MHLGRCISKCPPEFYGKATARGLSSLVASEQTYVKEARTSSCDACDASCYECVGSTANDCTSCYKDFYLLKATSTITHSYGSCEPKEPRGTFVYTLYVNPVNLWAANTLNVQSRTGELGSNNEFN